MGPGFESVTPGVLILILVMLYRYFTQLFDCGAVNFTKWLIGLSVLMVIVNIAKISFFDPGHTPRNLVLKKKQFAVIKGKRVSRNMLKRLLDEFSETQSGLLECEKCVVFRQEAR